MLVELLIYTNMTDLITYSTIVSLEILLFIFEVNMVKIAIIGCGLMGIKIAGI